MASNLPTPSAGPFLFSVDLEDVRLLLPDGDRSPSRVAHNLERYLELLDRHGARCTFFTVGELARRQPGLVAQLVAAGHEVACHSADHLPIERLGPDGFRDDLCRALDALHAAGAPRVRGFRAPMMSLTARTPWAHEMLADVGFHYSSSVIPVATALYGWPGFPHDSVRTDTGVWEIPVSVIGWSRRGIPFLSGVYFRLLPFSLIRWSFRRTLARGRPAAGYFHPYDIDTEEERFLHPELLDRPHLNPLMYWGRSRVLRRLDRLFSEGAHVLPYSDYVARVLERASTQAA